jgi:hypothetical protein
MSLQNSVSPEYIIFADEPINSIIAKSELYNGTIKNFIHRITDNFIIRINNEISLYGNYKIDIDITKINGKISLAILNVSIDLDTFKITMKNYNKETLGNLLKIQTKITFIDKIKKKLLKKVIKLTDKYSI